MRVEDLIHTSSNTWNIEAIRNHLPHYEDIITSIELKSFSMGDSMAWLPVKSRIYSNKSGYAIAKINKEPAQIEIFYWKVCVWNIRIAPKLKTFLWKLKIKDLAVRRNLTLRGISDVKRCKQCDAIEDELPIILYCPFAVKVWDLAPLLFKTDRNT